MEPASVDEEAFAGDAESLDYSDDDLLGLREVIAESLGAAIDEVAFAPVDVGDVVAPLPEEFDAASDFEAEMDAAAAVVALAPVAPEAPATVEQLVAASEVTPLGYVSCSVPPFIAKPMIGRLTTWPADRPVERRSVSMRCYMHTGCVSSAKGRTKISDDQLLRWLFSGEFKPDATSAQKKAGAIEHKAHFAAILAEVPE